MLKRASQTRNGAGRQVRSIAGVALAALLLGGVLSSCTSTPRAVLNVPGNYVADLWTPTVQYPSGGSPSASVFMCLDEASAVFLETGDGSWGGVGWISLTWAGVEYTTGPGTGDPVTLTTPVLQPGCGPLQFTVDCCHVDHYLAIKATKV